MTARTVSRVIRWAVYALIVCVIIAGESLLLRTTPLDFAKDNQEHRSESSHYEARCRKFQPAIISQFSPAPYHLCSAFTKHLIFIDLYHDTINVISTVFVALFTFTLWRSTIRLWAAGERQLEIADASLKHTIKSSVTTERAYLARQSKAAVEIMHYLTPDGTKIDRVEITPVWENSGGTPAINVEFCALEPIISESEIPDGISPTTIEMGPLPKIAIGKGQAISGGAVSVKIDNLIKCSRRECRIFLIFRIEYNDIFLDTPLRVTQYCEEYRFVGFVPITNIPPTDNWPFLLFGYAKFQTFS